MIDTIVTELVLLDDADNKGRGSLEDPSSTAIPFATYPKLSDGGNVKEPTQEKTRRDSGRTL